MSLHKQNKKLAKIANCSVKTIDNWRRTKPLLISILEDYTRENEKLEIEVTVKGERITIYNYVSKVKFNSIYDDSISYISNILKIFPDYAVLEYTTDYQDRDKAILVLVKMKLTF